MTLRQIAIQIGLLAVVFLVLANVLRYAFDEESPYLAAGACVLLALAWAIRLGWFRRYFD